MFRLVVIFLTVLILLSCQGKNKSQTQQMPGHYTDYVLLPNGWRLAPAGTYVPIDELPLNLVLTPDERYAFTTNNGYSDASLSVVDLQTQKEVQRVALKNAWVGLSYAADYGKLYVSGGNNDCVYVFDFKDGQLARSDSLSFRQTENEKLSLSGVAALPGKDMLLAASKGSEKLYAYDLKKHKVIHVVDMGAECYTVKTNHNKTMAYISLWGAGQVAEIDLQDFSAKRTFTVGDHPCDMIITSDDKYLFVANANNNSTSVVDLNSGKEIEKINSSLSSDVPYGSTPNGLAFNKDESVLFIANADNNYLALFDIGEKGHSKSLGFIPTGWYPTAVKFSSSANTIVVANGKGLSSLANPGGPRPGQKGYKTKQYIGSLFKGSLGLIPMPSADTLAVYSKRVYSNTPFTRKAAEEKPHYDQNVIPSTHDGKGSDKIKYVFYIIKENRTYDQIFGDIPGANGDSSLCLFGEKITPNHHKLAREFALFDNYYADAEVSADGHNWSTAAYASDYVEKTWPTNYGGRGGKYDFEGTNDITVPASGFIWDEVLKKGLSVRNYGEFAERVVKSGDTTYVANRENMKAHTCPDFCGWDLSISDLTRLARWQQEFDQFEKDGKCPNFNILRLPNDHTAGTRTDWLTPRAYLGQNDYALGKLVERISNSRFWSNSVIFVLEDDAQNGSDHVDAHRSMLLVISPFVKKGFVDHTLYSTSSVLKTIELVLGLPPMTQHDLSANAILNPFHNTPDNSPYVASEAQIDINEKNPADAYGSVRSAQMDLAREDAIPDVEFNEIIWKSVRGASSSMPAPVRSAFVTLAANEDDD